MGWEELGQLLLRQEGPPEPVHAVRSSSLLPGGLKEATGHTETEEKSAYGSHNGEPLRSRSDLPFQSLPEAPEDVAR